MSRVAFVGSSSVEPGSPLPAALAAELGLGSEWVALGRRGSRLSQWTSPVLPRDLRAIVVMIVANDARPTAARVREVDAAMRRFSGSVVWLPPPPYPAESRVAGRDRLMRRALLDSGVRWVEQGVVLRRAHWAPDRVHLTRTGYRAYARQVAPGLWGLLAGRAAERTEQRPPLPISRVFTSGGLRLAVTGEDALWLARACVGEGGGRADAAAVSSVMLRRWSMLRDGAEGSPFRSLSDLVVGRFVGPRPHEGSGREVELRGYSQPVSVQWRDRVDGRASRRHRIRSLRWSEIERWRQVAVLGVLSGAHPMRAPGAVHFASRDVVAQQLERRPGWRVVPVSGSRNVFVSTAASRGYRDPRVVGVRGYRAPRRPPRARSSRVHPSVARRSGGAAVLVGVAALAALSWSSGGTLL